MTMPYPIKRSIAFWISPQTIVHRVKSSHIEYVIDNIDLFNISYSEIRYLYNKHEEPWRCEGKAREEIIRKLISQGWIRVRRYKNAYSVNVKHIDEPILKILSEFAHQLMTTGYEGMYEADQDMPLNIISISITSAMDSDEQLSVTLRQLSSCPEHLA